jgi:hypothetical protein
MAGKAEQVLKEMGARNISANISSAPPPNLVAGGCRFGGDPATSVLDPDCRAHEVQNLYVSDGSFMPTGGSVPYTWTIYASQFADKIEAALHRAVGRVEYGTVRLTEARPRFPGNLHDRFAATSSGALPQRAASRLRGQNECAAATTSLPLRKCCAPSPAA